MREGLAWWGVLSAFGWAAWPLAAQLFRCAPARGYAFARAVGLLLVAYSSWLLGVVGLLPNSSAALWGVAIALAMAGGVVGWRTRRELGETLRREKGHILTVELLFALAFALYALHKAYDPAIDHTEEPMDFAFLNGILRSARFPPQDPWLAGHSISYYYLGYLMVAALTRLSGVTAGVGYNLGLANTLALAVVGAYGLLRWGGGRVAARVKPAPTIGAALGALAILGLGNLEGVLELAAARGWGSAAFWGGLNVRGLAANPAAPTWLPAGSWWWWRASRIISDANLLGKPSTVISEFPAFSLLLGDLHPHLMALPYLLLALAVAGELYVWGRHASCRGQENCRGVLQYAPTTGDAAMLLLAPLCLGSLGFLNSWDLPTILGLALLAYGVGCWQGRGAGGLFRRMGAGALWLLVGSVALYLPFWARLASQARGLGLVYYAKTPWQHYLLHWGPWLLPLVMEAALILRDWRAEGKPWWAWWRWGAAVFLAPWVVTAILGGAGRLLLGVVTALSVGPWLLLGQSALLAILLRDLWQRVGQARVLPGEERRLLARGLMAAALGLTYLIEFFYLRDMFDTRMNTVFKVYYQAWVLWGLGAMIALGLERRGWIARALRVASVGVFALCLYYPVAVAYTRAEGYQGTPTLDGTAYLKQESPAEYAAYRWLAQEARPGAVLVEAVGEEYDAATNRLSAWTGVPTLLGWPGHVAQWRGGDELVTARAAVVERLYQSDDAAEVLALLRAHQVTYLYVGPYERQRYSLDERRLAWYGTFLETAFAQGEVRLYRPGGH